MSGLLSQLNPGLLLIFVGFAGCLIPVQRVRQALMVGTPVVAILLLTLAERATDLSVVSVLVFDMIL